MSEVLSLKKYYRFLMWICLWVSFQQSTGIALKFVICLVLITAESLRLVINQKYCYSMFYKVPYTNIYLKIGFKDSCPFLHGSSFCKLFTRYVTRFPQRKDNTEISCRKVTHYQFLSWPDHGVLEYANPLLQFLKRIRGQTNENVGPIICHCSYVPK